jgi:hypothetical protein
VEYKERKWKKKGNNGVEVDEDSVRWKVILVEVEVEEQ